MGAYPLLFNLRNCRSDWKGACSDTRLSRRRTLWRLSLLALAIEQTKGGAAIPLPLFQGTGPKGSRAWHAMLAPFVTKGDNGASQPNYSQIGGLLISASLANAYYPESNRGPGLVFRNVGTNMGIHVALGLAQEFLLGKVTSRGKHKSE